MLILGLDTSAAHCAAAVLHDDCVLATRAEDMARGQAERLLPMIQQVLADAGGSLTTLNRIGVGIGPGNFTGLRIAVSAARGLALALDIPAIGVSSFDAIRLHDPGAVAAVPAPRGQVYLCAAGTETPRLVPADRATDAAMPPRPADLAICIARIAAMRAPGAPPAPLYLRAADAARSRDAPPVMLDDA